MTGGTMYFHWSTIARIAVACIITSFTVVNAADTPIEDALGDPETVSIATGRAQSIQNAPAVATVVTHEEIERIAPERLCDALEFVPGFHCLFRFQGEQYIIRGLQSRSNFAPDVLVMVDGVPFNDLNMGNQRLYMSQTPVVNIDRIEVIRGPGSALYGADAVSGVINIVTRTPRQQLPISIGARAGQFETGAGDVRASMVLGETAIGITAEALTTEGHRPIVYRDAQTQFDELFNTNASRAPGHANTRYRGANAIADLQNGLWRAKLRAHAHEVGMGAGFIGALDPNGEATAKHYALDLFYNNSNARPAGTVRWYASYFDYDIRTNDIQFFPPGAFGGTFPDGVIDSPEFAERRLRAEATRSDRFEHGVVTLGIGADTSEVYRVSERRNYMLSPSGIPVPTGQTAAVTGDDLFTKTGMRRLYYVYVQDEWDVARDWTLTTGVRYDHYSDFGGAASPRIAAVWNARYDLSFKALVGRAFRAPTFVELYAKNNPSTLGNSSLDPVVVDSAELALDRRLSARSTIRASTFYHRVKDVIAYVPDGIGKRASNSQGQTGYGYEIEYAHGLRSGTRFTAYFAR